MSCVADVGVSFPVLIDDHRPFFQLDQTVGECDGIDHGVSHRVNIDGFRLHDPLGRPLQLLYRHGLIAGTDGLCHQVGNLFDDIRSAVFFIKRPVHIHRNLFPLSPLNIADQLMRMMAALEE